MPRIFVDKAAERGFVRRALSVFPREYMEAVWGVRKGRDIYVHSFQELDHIATPGECEYASFEACETAETLSRFEDKCLDTMDDVASRANENGVKLLGKVHSHPYPDSRMFADVDDFPSYTDMEEDAGEGSLVTGICLIRKHKNGRKYTRVAYWPVRQKFDKHYYE